MDVQVRGKGITVTEAMREYAVRRVGKLTKHFATLHGAHVALCVEGQTQRVEVLLEGDGVKARCEDRGPDLYAAIDRVADKLERQMQKHKGRSHRNGHTNHHAHHHHYGHHGEVATLRTAPTILDTPPEPITGRIVRHKQFEIKPLSPEEAVEHMELLSHDFFVFANAQTGQVNVLYRRTDANYGILEPER
jgi:putative sigma-54 modulation protein